MQHDLPIFPRTILVTGARAPVALHWARLLAGAGHEVWLADTFAAPLARASRNVRGYIRLPSPRFAPEAFAQSLQAHCTRLGIGMIVPTCEEIFHLAQLAQRGAITTEVFAPPFDALAKAHDKDAFIKTCAAIGLPVPRSQRIETRSELMALHLQDHVFKPVWSRFGERVLIRPRPEDLRHITPSLAQPWLAQEVMEGEEISVFALAVQGDLRAISAYRGAARAGKGASVVFDPVAAPEIDAIVRRYVEATAWHGQISFDLKRDAAGLLRPIECNPRATSGLHFFTNGAALLGALAKNPSQKPAPQPPHEALQPPLPHPLHRPEVTGLIGSKLALCVYGRPLVQPKNFAALWRKTADIHAWPDDDISFWQQIKALRGILALALRHRISPQAASTYDIEWNGPKAL